MRRSRRRIFEKVSIIKYCIGIACVGFLFVLIDYLFLGPRFLQGLVYQKAIAKVMYYGDARKEWQEVY